LALQRNAGNRAVTQVLETEGGKRPPTGDVYKKKRFGLQTKLTVNEPGDIYEREADRIADQVMAAPAHSAINGAPPGSQRFSGQSNGQMAAAPASVDQALASPGRPLEPALRQDMEQRFGYDFSRVRVHADGGAANAARAVQARAYTSGRDIVFGSGEYAPATVDGKSLLAHELVHVVQQAAGTAGSIQGALAVQSQAPKDTDKEIAEKKCLTPISHSMMDAGHGGMIQRQPNTKAQDRPHGGKSVNPLAKRTPTVTELAKEVESLKTQQAVARKRQAATDLDLRWRAKFGERMASYKQAVWRIAAAINIAQKGFEGAQIAQSQTDQLTRQLFGVGVSFLFAGGFEWIIGAGLRGLGAASKHIGNTVRKPKLNIENTVSQLDKDVAKFGESAAVVSLPGGAALSKWTKFGDKLGSQSFLEVVENPANVAVSGYFTSIRGAQSQQRDTAKIASDVNKAEEVTEKGQESSGPGGDATAFLSRKNEALEQHWQDIERAFVHRSEALNLLSDAEWAKFDVDAQNNTYQVLLDRLNASASGVEKMEKLPYVAEIIEKYMWASWIINSADRESSGRLHNFGTDIDLRLIKIGVESQADVMARKHGSTFGLSEHWWQHSTDNWGYWINEWARSYKGSILK
jgi:hypothetical protein